MNPRVGLGEGWTGNVTTDALIDQGIQAGVKWASQQGPIQKLNQVASDTIAAAGVGGAIGTAIFPGIGTAIGTLAGAAISFIQNLFSGVGSTCTFTFLDGPPVQCAIYGRNVIQAVDWVRANPTAALVMHPSSLARQFNIAPGNELRDIWAQMERSFNGHYIGTPENYKAWVAAVQMPSATDLLRTIQMPAAAALLAAQPYKIPTALIEVPELFPALSVTDAQQLTAKLQPVLAKYVEKRNNEERAIGTQPGFTNSSSTSSTTSKVVKGVAITAVAATIGTWIYARITHQTVRQVVKTWVPSAMRGRRRNPLPSALGSTTAGRVLAYRVQLGFPGGDAITFNTDGSATYTQQQRAVAVFRPTTYQLAKIRTGRGEVLIFTDQILRNLLAP